LTPPQVGRYRPPATVTRQSESTRKHPSTDRWPSDGGTCLPGSSGSCPQSQCILRTYASILASRLTSSPGEPIPRSSALGRGREEGRPSSPPPPARLLKRKENSYRGPHRRLEVRSRCRMMVWEEDGGAAGGRVEGTDPFLRPTPADPLPQDDIPFPRLRNINLIPFR
jgi:hypothetical protein